MYVCIIYMLTRGEEVIYIYVHMPSLIQFSDIFPSLHLCVCVQLHNPHFECIFKSFKPNGYSKRTLDKTIIVQMSQSKVKILIIRE